MPYRAFHNRTGERYGRLLITGYAGARNQSRIWFCLCDCGNTCEASWKQLQQNNKTSCGCRWRETRETYGGLAGKNKLSSGESAFNQLFYSYQKSARERGYTFQLSRDEFYNLTQGECFYCGALPTIKFHAVKGTNGDFFGNGVDRIDNTLGYALGNVRSCCKQCNIAKGVLGEAEFIEWVFRVAARFEYGEKGNVA